MSYVAQNTSDKYTLLYEGLAKEGYKFIYVGGTPSCENCRLQGVCLANLETGRLYEVVSVRDVIHNCAVHDKVVAVKVREPDVDVAIKSKLAIPGSSITWNEKECNKKLCEYYRTLCNPEYLHIGDRLQIRKEYDHVSCPKGEELTRVEVTRLS